jgi:hypothetical protein
MKDSMITLSGSWAESPAASSLLYQVSISQGPFRLTLALSGRDASTANTQSAAALGSTTLAMIAEPGDWFRGL